MLVSLPDWYKDAVFYELHVKAFFDGDNDGMGDLAGLTQKLDYLQDLGITALWLLPFFPSPMRDDGYDISDYRSIHPAYGTLKDLRQLVKAAHRRGMRVLIELVVNHTSDQHPWFQRARRAKPGSVHRDYYVWSDTTDRYQGTRVIFTDTEKSNWTWDAVANQFYWHRFFAHQPDLNFDNPHVFRAVMNTMRFWLDLGVDGFRLDAIPYLCEREGTSNENLPETHAVIQHMRAELDRHYRDRVLLCEANQWPEDVRDYFGKGDECHMAFHFPLMPRMYMAIAQEDRHPITDIMRQTPEIPDNCQWAIFLRNHDELTLEMVTDSERDYLWSTYAIDRRARLNLGIRRRLAPLMDNDRRKIELMNSLLLSMPGTPIIYYGDEIGMGDNIFLGDRNGVRTPMQWTPDRNGGFSRADPAGLYLPPIMDAIYGYQAVNVEAQTHSLTSLLNWMKRLIGVRQSLRVFGRGTLSFLYPSNRTVIAYLREHDDATVLCVANLSRSAQAVQLDLARFVGYVPLELLGQSTFPAIGDGPYIITLHGYGFYWFQLNKTPQAARQTTWQPDWSTLIVQGQFASVVEGRNRRILEQDVFPTYLRERRWFAHKHLSQMTLNMPSAPVFVLAGKDWCWSLLRAEAADESAVYAAPLAADWEPATSTIPAAAIAKLRRGAQVGYLLDAPRLQEFAAAVVSAVRENREIDTTAGKLAFRTSTAWAQLPWPEQPVIRIAEQEQSNSSAIIEDTLICKVYRRVAPGVHPEVEIGRYLTERVRFANAPDFLGSVQLRGSNGGETALAVLHRLVRTQGDGWTYTASYLDRFLEESRVAPVIEKAASSDAHAAYLSRVETLARRTAELHQALSSDPEDPAFVPERVESGAIAQWGDAVARLADDTLQLLARNLARLPEEAAAIVHELLHQKPALLSQIKALTEAASPISIARHHGDYHLGQVLIAQNDIYVVDFEGPPQIPLDQRRAKRCVLRDIAGMLRSFDYAAWSALDRATVSQPDRRNELLQAVLLWRDDASQRFLNSYLDAMDASPLLPAEEGTLRRLLSLHLIEKAAMEASYELANRPSWVGVPLRGFKAMVAP